MYQSLKQTPARSEKAVIVSGITVPEWVERICPVCIPLAVERASRKDIRGAVSGISAGRIKMIRPALWLLEKYHHPYFLVYTNSPGEIVYEDQFQVVAKTDGFLQIDELQPSWSPEES